VRERRGAGNPTGLTRAVGPGVAAADHSTPIVELNITPLIDVMLVLLVMFILVLPPLTHEVPIELPRPLPDPSLPLVPHRLVLARAGGVTLDGIFPTDAALATKLAPIVADRQATLTLRTDPETRYERFDQVLAVVKRAGVTRLGFEGKAS
jgi:biopolymer transport protein ExbD